MELKEILEKFDARFWEHRVPKNTKQSQDIKQLITEAYEAGRKFGMNEIIHLITTLQQEE